MPLEVTRVTTDAQRQSAYAIRSAVFVNEQNLPGERQFDDYDLLPDTLHFIGTDSDTGKVVATARTMVVAAERKGKVGRVAVRSECRGKSYGVAIMAAAEAAIQDQCDFFVLSAQCDKRGFYEKCGYRPMNDETYDEMGIEHLMMIKYVTRA